jgi:hypothetical protein
VKERKRERHLLITNVTVVILNSSAFINASATALSNPENGL